MRKQLLCGNSRARRRGRSREKHWSRHLRACYLRLRPARRPCGRCWSAGGRCWAPAETPPRSPPGKQSDTGGTVTTHRSLCLDIATAIPSFPVTVGNLLELRNYIFSPVLMASDTLFQRSDNSSIRFRAVLSSTMNDDEVPSPV